MTDKPTVLVIEDEKPLQEAIKKKLEDAGLTVITARSIKQGLECLSAKSVISAIWLDHYLLGEGNGLDFVATIKAKGSTWRNIPIFLVTNTASQDKISSYLELGIEKYYTKSDHALADIVRDIVDTIRQTNHLEVINHKEQK